MQASVSVYVIHALVSKVYGNDRHPIFAEGCLATLQQGCQVGVADDASPYLIDVLPVGRCGLLGNAANIREHLLLHVCFTLGGQFNVQSSLTRSTAKRCNVEVLDADLLKSLLHVLTCVKTEAPVLLLPVSSMCTRPLRESVRG